MNYPPRQREAVWILLHSPQLAASQEILLEQIRETPHEGLLQDPVFLRAFLKRNMLDNALLAILVPTPAIVGDRDIVVQILQKFPSFLRHPDIPQESKIFSERYAFEATAQTRYPNFQTRCETTPSW